MKSWTICGYELACMQALDEGFCSEAFNCTTLVKKGLAKPVNESFELTLDGSAVLEAIQDHLDSFQSEEDEQKGKKGLHDEGPVKSIDIEFDDNMKDVMFIGSEHVQDDG